ncbi:Lipase, class 3 [Corchorus olitorius]|uniref:Phospholipase A1 n=1 Tax=Corchorus olitorius TaxID=93759 RepID=A0A1R3H4S2_9ROSI|nr:Lipase, class 3 [Corchorus olitorius]
MAVSISSRWRKLSGEKNWEGLLNPLDINLRHYLIHYGEKTAAVGDLFNNEEESEGFGNSLFPKEEFFPGAGLEKGNKFKYNVTHFLYAGSDVVKSAWFGYVAVATDEGKAALGRRDILVSWRGTITDSEWFNNAQFFPKSASELFGNDIDANVHSGFLDLYTGTSSNSANNKTSARDQVLKAIRELVDKYKDEEISITVTGHSLGGALATLNAMDIVANGYNKPTSMVTAFVYGGPRVGNDGLERLFQTLGDDLHLLRITNRFDPVHHVPFENMGYTHLGKELTIDTSKSDYLKRQFFVDILKFFRQSMTNIEDSLDIIRSRILTINAGTKENLRISSSSQTLNSDGRILVKESLEILVEENSAMERGRIQPRGIVPDFIMEHVGQLFIAHDLEIYLHGVAGEQKDGFRVEVDRDIALINKHLDHLKDDYKVPAEWWRNENRKNMVQMENGHWKFVQNLF